MKKLDVHRVCREWRGGSHHIIWESDDKLTFPNQVFTVLPRGTWAIVVFGSEAKGEWNKGEGEQGKKAEGQN